MANHPTAIAGKFGMSTVSVGHHSPVCALRLSMYEYKGARSLCKNSNTAERPIVYRQCTEEKAASYSPVQVLTASTPLVAYGNTQQSLFSFSWPLLSGQ